MPVMSTAFDRLHPQVQRRFSFSTDVLRSGSVRATTAQLKIARALALPASMFVPGVLCAALHLGKPAFRFAAFAAVIVILTPRPQLASILARHRFAEVAIGIGVGLLFQWRWPESPRVVRAT
jgi:hypothetical protein